jgi:hypothetical protein
VRAGFTLGSLTPSSSGGGGGSTTLFQQGQPFTLVGSGFGTYTTQVLIEDKATAAVGTVDPQWTDSYPNTGQGASGTAVWQLQPSTFAPSGATIGVPHPYVSKFYAGCRLTTANIYNQMCMGIGFTPPAFPYVVYAESFERRDPGFNIHPEHDNNAKDWVWSQSNHVWGGSSYFYTNWAIVTGYPVNGVTLGSSTTVINCPQQQATAPFAVGQTLYPFGIEGTTQLNSNPYTVTAVAGGFGNWQISIAANSSAFGTYQGALAISGITQATNPTFTLSSAATSNPINVGDFVYVSGVLGMTQVNQAFLYVVSTAGSAGAWQFTVNSDAIGTAYSTSGFSAYTSGGTVTTGRISVPYTNATATGQCDSDAVASGYFQNPDQNGHNPSFNSQMLWQANPANGWVHRKYEMCVTNAAGAIGYFNVYDNNVLVMNYSGPTDTTGNPTQRSVCFGTGYWRNAGANCFGYSVDQRCRISATGVSGHVARVELMNASTPASATKTALLDISTWTDTQITGTVWLGELVGGSQVWPVVSTESGTQQVLGAGTAVAPVAFDYFISPTGDDNNAGTLASPWSLTALNHNQATYSGKKIGFLPGTYQYGTKGGVQSGSIYAFLQTGANGCFVYVNGGTSSNPTYLASCNASGQYQARTAILDGSNPSGGALPNADQAYVIGNAFYGVSTPAPITSYITIDGLVVQNFTFSGIGMGDGQNQLLNGIVIQNCQVGPATCSTSANNPGGLFLGNCVGAQVLNCKIINCTTTGGSYHPSGMGGITTYITPAAGTTGTGLVVTNTTITGCGYAIQDKDNHQWGTYSYCYFDCGTFGSYGGTGSPGAAIRSCIPGSGQTLTMHHNIMLSWGYYGFGEDSGTIAGSISMYNNTIYQPTTITNGLYALWIQQAAGAGPHQFYNNVVYSATSNYGSNQGSGLYGAVAISSTTGLSAANWDFNYYGTGCTFGAGASQTWAAFKTALGGADAHSIQGGNPFASTPVSLNANSFALTGAPLTGGKTGLSMGALDGTGTVGCNF